MRIGMDIRELEENKRTGIGRFILNFLNFINTQDKENEYLLFGNQKTRLQKFGNHIKSKIIPEFCRIFWDQVTLSVEIRREKIDIFFSPLYKGPILSGAKLIVICHDLYFLEFEKNPLIKCLKSFYCKLTGNNADFIVTPSEYSRQEVIKFLRCSPKKVRVVNNSVEDKFLPMDRGAAFIEILNRFARIKKDFILYVGNFKPHKNVSRIIEAYSLLPASLKDRYQLVIVGKKDKDYLSLSQLVGNYNLMENIEFLDVVREEDLIFLYSAASALILVSLREGFGLPALEAMACGTPVVVSNASALPEVAGEAGLYVDPQDARDISSKIQSIIDDERLRSELSLKGLEQAKKFSIESSGRRILELFREVKQESSANNL